MSDRVQRLATVFLRIAALEDRIKFLSKKYPKIKLEIIKGLAEFDPTKNKGYLEWLVRQVISGKFRYPEDGIRATEMLAAFDRVKRAPSVLKQFEGQADINKYDFHSLVDLTNKILGRNISESTEFKVFPGSKIIYNQMGNQIIQVGGPGMNVNEAISAACHYSDSTSWCTRHPETVLDYLRKGPLYILYRDFKKIAQIHPQTNQFMDIRDRPIDPAILGPELITVLAKLKILPEGILGKIFRKTKERLPQLEEAILENPHQAISYTKNTIKTRWPALEKKLLDEGDAYDCMLYALTIMKRRWPAAEPIIQEVPIIYEHYSSKFKSLKGKDQLPKEAL